MTFQASDKNPPYGDVSSINIPFSKKKYKEILKLCNLDIGKDLDDHHISQIFVNSVYKWLKGEWSLDDLSCIGNKFWAERKDKFDELGTALYAAGESTFYVRRIYSPKRNDNKDYFSRWILDIMEYYEANRAEVVK